MILTCCASCVRVNIAPSSAIKLLELMLQKIRRSSVIITALVIRKANFQINSLDLLL